MKTYKDKKMNFLKKMIKDLKKKIKTIKRKIKEKNKVKGKENTRNFYVEEKKKRIFIKNKENIKALETGIKELEKMDNEDLYNQKRRKRINNR